MISSLNKKVLLATAVTAALISAGSIAAAQEKPRSLVPSFVEDQVAPKTGASETLTAPAVPAAENDPFQVPTSTTGSDLQIQSLSALHAASVDVTADNVAPLGSNIWNDMSGQLVQALLARVHGSDQSPTMTNLYGRLILNGATIPDQSVVADDVLSLRLKKIVGQGFFEAANTYFGQIPSNSMTDALRKHKVELMLLDGREEAVCADETVVPVDANTVFWAKFDTYCRLVANDFDKAELGAALLEERGDDDPLFFALVAALVGSPVDFDGRSETVEPVHYAMLKRRDAAFPASLIVTATLPVKKAFLSQPERLKSDKIQLALDVIRSGNPVSLQSLGPLTDAPETAPPYGALIQAITANPLPDEKARSLAALWQAANDAGDTFALSQLSLELLTQLPVGGYGQEFNRQAVRILLLNDRVAQARQWERAARRAAIQGTPEERLDARKDITRLNMYVLLAGIDGIARWNGASFNNWLTIMGDDPNVSQKAAFLLTMMEVFGYSVSDADWDRLLYLDQPANLTHSNHAFENILVTAAVQKQKGKTVALSVLSMTTAQGELASLTTLRAVTSALKAVGLESDARKLALETAILLDL